jgi:hypothetical protein
MPLPPPVVRPKPKKVLKSEVLRCELGGGLATGSPLPEPLLLGGSSFGGDRFPGDTSVLKVRSLGSQPGGGVSTLEERDNRVGASLPRISAARRTKPTVVCQSLRPSAIHDDDQERASATVLAGSLMASSGVNISDVRLAWDRDGLDKTQPELRVTLYIVTVK